MKPVNMKTVRDRINLLETAKSETGTLSLATEFELSCLLQLLAAKTQLAELAENNRAVTAEVKFKEMLEAEHSLSDAYIRIREICGTISLPPGSDIWKETEKAASAMAKSYAQLAELAKQKTVGTVSIAMDWNTHRNVATVNMRHDLVVSEMKDGDELFTRAVPAAVPEGWKLVPVEPDAVMCDIAHVGIDPCTGITDEPEYYSINGEYAAKVYRAMLELSPECAELRRTEGGNLDDKRRAFIDSMQDDTAPEQYESLRKGE